jgi:hypothetical protein
MLVQDISSPMATERFPSLLPDSENNCVPGGITAAQSLMAFRQQL